MAYYRRGYRSKHARQRTAGMERALQHIGEYNALASRLGPIVDDIKKAFFGLSGADLARLLNIYEKQNGAKAANYARKTFGIWKAGQRKMSGQTAERLLNLVPKYLDFQQRYRMLNRLCDHHVTKRRVHVTINTKHPADGLSALKNHMEDFCNIDTLKHLPGHVMDTATWLHDSDIVATRALLSQIDKENSEAVHQVARKEFGRIRAIVARQDVSSISQVIEFPTGTISVSFKKPSLWDRLFG